MQWRSTVLKHMNSSTQIHDIEFAETLDEIVNETLPALEQIVKEGKAKYIGVTGYPLEPLKEVISRSPGRVQVD